jgi:hypothetical protein
MFLRTDAVTVRSRSHSSSASHRPLTFDFIRERAVLVFVAARASATYAFIALLSPERLPASGSLKKVIENRDVARDQADLNPSANERAANSAATVLHSASSYADRKLTHTNATELARLLPGLGRIPLAGNHLARGGRLAGAPAPLLMQSQH